jgi:predicted dehydrogenase
MFAIVGAGFGLYGYLPAVVEGLGERVVLPRAYEERARARPELARALASTIFVDDLEAALDRADAVVIATPPRSQAKLVAACLARPRVRRLVLEKPLAATPELAQALLDHVRESGRGLRVGYTLLHAAWMSRLAWPRGEAMALRWTFMAHHFARGLDNWKRHAAEGGGVLRFFGIHVVALAAAHGYAEVAGSSLQGPRGEPERWMATFHGPGLGMLEVVVDSRSPEARFELGAAGQPALVDLDDPFALEPGSPPGDKRVAILARLLASFDAPDGPELDLYRRVNSLWAAAEAA